MTDLVVTVPRNLWSEWIEEGDAVGSPESGEEWGFFLGHSRPPIEPGERLYIVAHDRLRGYAPVTRVAFFVDACQRDACIETDLWLSRNRAAAKREAAKVSTTATSSPPSQGDLFE